MLVDGQDGSKEEEVDCSFYKGREYVVAIQQAGFILPSILVLVVLSSRANAWGDANRQTDRQTYRHTAIATTQQTG